MDKEKHLTNSVLVAFLGRAPKGVNGYRTTCYDFGDGGKEQEPLAFFGLALQRRLRPDRLVVLGTAGSMWDHLFEGDVRLDGQAEEARMALIEAVEHRAVEQAQLDELAPLLAGQLDCGVRLQLIPYCRNDREQAELLRILGDVIAPCETVDLDVTHGFRHLPMLAMLAALYLRKVRGAKIRNIWYGAFDPDTGNAPVMQLGGLLHIADWLEALAVYEHSGDYGVFDPLLPQDVDRRLVEANFLESVNRIGQARAGLQRVLSQLDDHGDTPAFSLFRPVLRQRIDWAQEKKYYLRQRDLAYNALDRKRYLDATLKGWEAFTTLLQLQGSNHDPDNHGHREAARERFETAERVKKPRSERWRAYDSLRRLRNAVAHGSQPKGEEVQRALSSPQEMHRLLSELFSLLLEQPS